VFVPDGEERTVAELGDAYKVEHSHRSRAVRALREAFDRLDGVA
jgi:inosine/xanthosine triphosphate pyrophosphatase family protein